ncbi:actin-depolymerizing factor 7 [Quercus suber]|uniref:Actin-depolymerizing factor 7 n=1 Tax=Quercus suber TaxID=58331 RepID=A0AAW0MA99_QUESU
MASNESWWSSWPTHPLATNQEVVVEKLGIPDEAYEHRYPVFIFDFITDQSFQKSKLFFIAWPPFCVRNPVHLQHCSHIGLIFHVIDKPEISMPPSPFEEKSTTNSPKA